MNPVDLREIDLNLLVVLDELFEQGSVTRTAHTLGKTQSAVSHSLGRLRSLFDDALFVREGRQMVPTQRARSLETPVRAVLTDIQRILVQPGSTFDPRRLDRRFVVVATDLAEVAILPALLARLREESDTVELATVGVGGDVTGRIGRSDGYDLALGFGCEQSPLLVSETLFEEHLVCVFANNHPRLADKHEMTLEDLRSEDHILIAPQGQTGTLMDTALARMGVARRKVLSVSHAATATLITAQTDLVLTVPFRVASNVQSVGDVSIVPAPAELPTFHCDMAYRPTTDPAHQWLCQMIREIAAAA